MSGGVILGQTAIFLFHSLEILTGNTGLMNQLEIFIKDSRVLLEHGGHLISPINNSDNINYIFVSLLMVEFTASSSLWLLPPGIFIGLETYKLVIKKWSKTEQGEALTLAGSVCMTVVTAAGCDLGLGLELSDIYFQLQHESVCC